MKKPVILMILDGYGISNSTIANAIAGAKTPNLDKLFNSYPNSTLGASGMNVGLPEGQMGNSEVGHTNIGAGRIVYQELTRISKAIVDKDFFENEALNSAMENLGDNTLHLMGLLSDGGVHSHNSHLYALVELAKQKGVKNVAVHSFLDGRDVPPKSGGDFVAELEQKLLEIGVGFAATITGRFYAMDRDNRWERVAEGYNAIAKGEGTSFTNSASALAECYQNDVTDEFIKPLVKDGYKGIKENDAIIFFNFRPDRAREITRAFVDPAFDGFEREKIPLSSYVCMTSYDKTMPNCTVAFSPQSLENTLGEVICKAGMKQLRIAETEKYAHVTFFFNGGLEAPFENEDRILVPSPKVETYDQMPEMSAFEVADKLVEAMDNTEYSLIVLNFANCDMVGHTGVYSAAVKAVETVDSCVGKVVEKALAKDAVVLLTADHGNAEEMAVEDGSPMTAHSVNPVPIIVIGAEGKGVRDDGVLCDLAPTVLELLEIEKPSQMSGKSLLV